MNNFETYGILAKKGRKYENILYIMALIYGIINKEFEDYFQANGLSTYKFNILTVAAFQNEGKGISQVEIGRHMITTTAGNIAKLVDSLYKEGFLTRVQNPKSRRENIIKITPAGRKRIDEVWGGYDALARKLADMLPKEAHDVFADNLAKWFLNLKRDVK